MPSSQPEPTQLSLPAHLRPREQGDDDDSMFWELTQDQADLFDALPDAALADQDPEEAAEEGPPVVEDDRYSSDSELWKNFNDDFD